MPEKVPIRFSILLLMFIWIGSVPEQGFAQNQVDFHTEIVPVLTKLGCNSGACHGAAVGRGGFKLSLYGSQPASDFRAITRDSKGRRIHRKDPLKSLLIRKPGGDIDHGGDQRFDISDPAGQRLIHWIEQGAALGRPNPLLDFDVGESPIQIANPGGVHAFRFHATFQDGSSRDVTAWTVLTSNDPSSVSIDPRSNRATIHRRGRHVVLARFLNRIAPIEILVPYYDSNSSIVQSRSENLVDRYIDQKLDQLNIPSSDQVDDAAFLRRLSLDLTGRLPTPDQREQFLADERTDKRSQLIDELLNEEAFTDFWTYQLATQLQIRSQPGDPKGAYVYHHWLRDQIKSKQSWNKIAREMLLAKGDSHLVGQANFYRTAGDARLQSEFVTEALLGVRLRCANCHDHPLDHWTQDDYHGLAAVFSQVRQSRFVQLNPAGENIHARTGKPAIPRIPGDSNIGLQETDVRVPLADWMLADSNPYFARAMVNRIWKSLMGRGLVEPLDDLRSTNPATHPELLQRLAEDFQSHGFQLRHSIGLICNSQAYQRSVGPPQNPEFHALYWGDAMIRPLQAEVLADSIGDVTGIWESYEGMPLTTRAIELHDPRVPAPSLDVLGRCSRDGSCAGDSAVSGGLASQLHLLNGPLVNQKISQPGSRLHTLIAAQASPEEIVSDVYRRALSREPNGEELEYWVNQMSSTKPGSRTRDRRQRWEDFVWSMLNSREFTTNH